jgi:hypothetical protein
MRFLEDSGIDRFTAPFKEEPCTAEPFDAAVQGENSPKISRFEPLKCRRRREESLTLTGQIFETPHVVSYKVQGEGTKWALGIGFALLSAPQSLRACAACFGRSDSELAEGLNMGIFALLGFVLLVMVWIGGFFAYMARRANTNVESTESEGPVTPTATIPPA